jgi:hypothetical protein
MSTIEDDDNKKRIDKYIDESDCKQQDYERVFVRGKKKILSVYRLPTEFLYFNIQNGRFAAEYREKIRIEGGVLDPKKPGDEKIIQKMLLDLDPAQTKLDKKDFSEVGQRKAGVITPDGYVIDGNRRLAIITSMFAEKQEEQWKYMNVARLTEPLQKEDLWRLEGGYQLGKEQQQKYGPINTMLKIREGKDAGLSNKQIADALYGVKEKEIEDMLERLKLVERYLEHINAPERYSLAQGKDNHFINLQAIISNCKQRGYDRVKITNMKTAAFQLIFEGKKHEDIRKINQAINADLDDAVDGIAEAGGKIDTSENNPDTMKPQTLGKVVGDVVDDDGDNGDDDDNNDDDDDDGNDNPLTVTDTHFHDLTDELNVHKNKDHISLLLKSAEKNLKFIAETSELGEEIKKEESVSVIEQIFLHVQKLKEKING